MSLAALSLHAGGNAEGFPSRQSWGWRISQIGVMTMRAPKYTCIDGLTSAGIAYQDAQALRRIAMTLHRWFELECGDGNQYGSWAITRGRKETRYGQHAGGHGAHHIFIHDDNGAPFTEHHHYLHGKGTDYVTYSRIPDREAGAKKRLGVIMSRYPSLRTYIQGDPRGAVLYVLRPSDIPEGATVDSCYSHGIAVYK